MGRQHTIYLSDASFEALMTLKKADESMSQVIRNSLSVCAENQESFDLVSNLNKQNDALRRRLARVEIRLCNRCLNDLKREAILL